MHVCPECGQLTTGYAHIELIRPKKKHRFYWYAVCPHCAIKPDVILARPIGSVNDLIQYRHTKYRFHYDDDIIYQLFNEKSEEELNQRLDYWSRRYIDRWEKEPSNFINTLDYAILEGRCVAKSTDLNNKPSKNRQSNNTHHGSSVANFFINLFNKSGLLGFLLMTFIIAIIAALVITLITHVFGTLFYYIFIQ